MLHFYHIKIEASDLIQWFLGVFGINTSSNFSKLSQNITSRFPVETIVLFVYTTSSIVGVTQMRIWVPPSQPASVPSAGWDGDP